MDLTIVATSVTHHTFVLDRLYPVSPERVFAALSDPAKKRRWLLESGSQQVEDFTMDFRVGGVERATSRMTAGPLKGTSFTSDGVYLDIVPNQRVVSSASMALGDRRISASLVTFELQPSGQSTRLLFTHQGAFFEGADGPEMREGGWRKLLDSLAEELGRQQH